MPWSKFYLSLLSASESPKEPSIHLHVPSWDVCPRTTAKSVSLLNWTGQWLCFFVNNTHTMTRIILSTASESKHPRHGRERAGLILMFLQHLEDVQNFHNNKKDVRSTSRTKGPLMIIWPTLLSKSNEPCALTAPPYPVTIHVLLREASSGEF